MESLDHTLQIYTLSPHFHQYTWEQHSKLEKHFQMDAYPDDRTCLVLATRVNLTVDLAKAWFDKRRAAAQVLMQERSGMPSPKPRIPRRSSGLHDRPGLRALGARRYHALRRRLRHSQLPWYPSGCPLCYDLGFPKDQTDLTIGSGSQLPAELEAFQKLSLSAPSTEQDGDAEAKVGTCAP